MNSYLTSSYTAIVIIGDNFKFIENICSYIRTIKNCSGSKIGTVCGFKTGIIDFIVPNWKFLFHYSVNNEEFSDFMREIRDFMASSKYLQIHTIWCIEHMRIALQDRIEIYESLTSKYVNSKTIVAWRPVNLSWNLYSHVCQKYKLLSYIFNQCELTKDDVRIIIKSVFVDDFEYLFDLFESM